MFLEMGFCVAEAGAVATWWKTGEEAGDAEGSGEESSDGGGRVGLGLDLVAADAGRAGGGRGGMEEGRILGEGDADFAGDVRRELAGVRNAELATGEIEGWPEERHLGVSFLAECLTSALVDETPLPVPGEALGFDFPVDVGWDLEPRAAFNRVDVYAVDLKPC